MVLHPTANTQLKDPLLTISAESWPVNRQTREQVLWSFPRLESPMLKTSIMYSGNCRLPNHSCSTPQRLLPNSN